MKQFFPLLKINMLNRAAALHGSLFRNRKGKVTFASVLGGALAALFFLLILALVIVLEFFLFEALKQIGRPELLLSLSLTGVMACMGILSFFFVLTSLYYGKDIPFLAALPVRSRTVFSAKLAEVLLAETGIALVILAPAMILYGLHAQASTGYYTAALLVSLTSAMLPVSILALLSTLIVRLTGASRHRDAVAMLYSVLILAAVLAAELSMSSTVPDDADALYYLRLLISREALMQQISQAFPPSWWAMQGLMGNAGSLLGYLACAMGAMTLVCLLLGPAYLKASLSLTEQTASRRKHRRAENVRQRSPLAALFILEWRVLRTPAYAFNSFSSVILLPVLLVSGLFGANESLEIGGIGTIFDAARTALASAPPAYAFLGFAAGMTFVCCVNPAVDTAVSREGGRHMLNRMLPVESKIQLQAKLLMGMSINALSCLPSLILLCILLPETAGTIFLSFLLAMLMNVGMCAFSITLDASRPNFHWRSETQAIKQNNNIGFSMLLSFLLLLLPAAAFFLSGALDLSMRAALTVLVCALEATAGYALFMTFGCARYARLEDGA